MKTGVIPYYIAAFFLFLILWPLQMHHWLGEAFIQQGMGVKNEIDFLEQRALPHYRGQPEEEQIKDRIDRLYDRVYEIFDKSIAFYPQYMETYYIVGRYYIDGGTYRLQVFEDPDMSRFERGAEVLRRDIRMNPNYKWAHNNVGVIYDKLAQLAPFAGKPDLSRMYEDKAREHYQIALRIDPEQIFALFNLGSGYLREGQRLYRRGKPEEADEFFDRSEELMWRCIAVQPHRKDCYENIADTARLQKDYVALVNVREEYLEMMRKRKWAVMDEMAYIELGLGYVRAKEPVPPNEAARPEGPLGPEAPALNPTERGERAREVLVQARRMVAAKLANPNLRQDQRKELEIRNEDITRLLGQAAVLAGQAEEAADVYKVIIEGGTKDPVAYYDAVRLSIKAGRPDEARGFAEKGLADPDVRESLYFRILGDPDLKKIREAPWFIEFRDRYEPPALPVDIEEEGVAPLPKPGT